MGVANETSPSSCEATTKYGKPCTRSAQPGKTVCHSHDPAYAEERKRNARAGGVAVHSPATEEIEDVKATLWELIRETREEVLAPQVGSTVIQAANTILRAIEQTRRVREQDEIERRLDLLESGGEEDD